GILMACSGIGAVTGGLLAGRASRIHRTGMFVILAAIGYGGIALGIAGSSTFLLTALLVCIGSFTGSIFQSVTNTIIFTVIDDRYRGRVTGIYMLTFGLYPLGGLPMGYLADLTSVPFAITTGAIFSSSLAAILALRAREMREVSLQLSATRPTH
ncbi:MAG: MFS transporter, partial [Chloroflexota bacterium]